MPVDHKRINGPEDTVPYSLYTKTNKQSLTEQYEEIRKTGQRTDSRAFSEHRKIFVRTGAVSQAKGSAYIELDNTKVIVSVFDPREIPNRPDYSLKGELYCEFKFAPFSCHKRRLHVQDAEEKQHSAIMKRALESTVCLHEFPNFQVDVYATVLENDGSCLSAAITAAGLALAHAGVPMYDIITSVTMGIQRDTFFVDPTVTEQNICLYPRPSESDTEHGIVVLSKLHTHDQVSQFYQFGNVSLDKLNESISILDETCRELVPIVQKYLVKHVVKNLQRNT
ncbi:unnamed protein product [Phyllotreta striolata]|uniref:Exoribonuclease phosphorolytic domain-containing protein n=1 Tax=Phyllotreta striolata TaxID=444603 RepID=A0A9N9TPW1_PHYSR|nr:unnamed protein product [Phyllotreta striolata]